jgi:type II secretory pathway pseudopilin PulG
MMVVVAIMMILVVAGATRMQMSKDSRRAREAARTINVYLSSARNRAMETGRPCGVIFRVLANSGGTVPCALNADQCEVPPCYCGVSETSMATITATSPTSTTANVTFLSSSTNSTPEFLLPSMIRLNDLIQFNAQGPLYAITGALSGSVDATTGYLSNVSSVAVTLADTNQVRMMPWTTAGTVSFRIFPAPMPHLASPMQLPAGSVVDLYYSGTATTDCAGTNTINTTSNASMDFTVLFSPNGSVDRIYYGSTPSPVTDAIYLMVGKRERVGLSPTFQSAPAKGNESSWANYQDMENALWITINPQTGLVNTEPVSAASTGGVPITVSDSRALAAQAQGKGGQ